MRAALDDPGFDPNLVLDQHIARLAERIALQRQLLDRLRVLRAGNEAAWPELLDTIALIARLRHPEATVRVRAALDADPIPLPVLIERIAAETDPDVLGVLVWAVARHGRPAVAPVIDLLGGARPGVRLHVVHALDKLGERGAVPALRTLLDDPEPAIRAAGSTPQEPSPTSDLRTRGRFFACEFRISGTVLHVRVSNVENRPQRSKTRLLRTVPDVRAGSTGGGRVSGRSR